MLKSDKSDNPVNSIFEKKKKEFKKTWEIMSSDWLSWDYKKDSAEAVIGKKLVVDQHSCYCIVQIYKNPEINWEDKLKLHRYVEELFVKFQNECKWWS